MIRKYKAIIIPMLAILLLLHFSVLLAQTKTKKEKKFSDKLFFGGSIGMAFSNTVTRIDILPEAGIWIIPQWAIGIGGRYTFRKERFNVIGGEIKPYKAHIWGFSGFTQILPIKDLDKAFHIGIKGGIIFYGEWEGLYFNKGLLNPTASEQQGKGWVHLFLVGGGYRVPLGDKVALNILVLWDLTNNTYSPYTTNPLLRLSISF